MVEVRRTTAPPATALTVPFVAWILWASGCATMHAPSMVATAGDFCLASDTDDAELTASPIAPGASHDESVADVIGVGTTYRLLRASPDDVSDEQRRVAFERVELVLTIVEATAAEIDCEGERADQVVTFLAARDAHVQNALTTASIVTGAGTAIGTAALGHFDHLGPHQNWLGATGGAASAALALGLFAVHTRAEFRHERNYLADVWNGPLESRVFPPVVWAFLTRTELARDGALTGRERLVSRWREFRTLADPHTFDTVLFGSGGRYDVELLQLRAALLEQVKAEVSLVNRDVASLAMAMLRH